MVYHNEYRQLQAIENVYIGTAVTQGQSAIQNLKTDVILYISTYMRPEEKTSNRLVSSGCAGLLSVPDARQW